VECVTTKVPYNWAWKSQHEAGLAARFSRLNRIMHNAVRPIEYCNGNADLYYVSREAWQPFSLMIIDAWLPQSKKSGEDYIINEVAIPHTMVALGRAGYSIRRLCMTGRRDYGLKNQTEEQSRCCWGAADATAGSRVDIYDSFSCGHKAALELPVVKQTLLRSWLGSNDTEQRESEGEKYATSDAVFREVPADYGTCLCHNFCSCR